MKHNREIFAIALPAIVSNITTPLLGLVDVAVTGHIGAPVYIAAIAVGGTMFNMLYWLFNFLRMSTTGLTAQAYGAGGNECATILYRSMLAAILTGCALLLLSEPLADTILSFMDADDESSALARRYFGICIWGAPAVMLTYSMSGWFLGMQNSKAQMWMAIITNLVNTVISIVLVFGFKMKIEGVATGTLTAQWIGAAAGAAFIFFRYRPEFPAIHKLLDTKSLLRFFRLNTDIFLRTACLVAVTLWFTHAGAIQGTDVLAANALLLQLFMLFSFFMDGFAFSGEALTGKYHGAGDLRHLSSLIKSLMTTGLACALLFSIVYFLAGDMLLNVLAKDRSVTELAGEYLPWAAAVPLCGFAAFIWDGIFVGLVRTRGMLLSMFAAMCVFFAAYFTFRPLLYNNAQWLAFNLYLLTRGLMQYLLYRRQISSL